MMHTEVGVELAELDEKAATEAVCAALPAEAPALERESELKAIEGYAGDGFI